MLAAGMMLAVRSAGTLFCLGSATCFGAMAIFAKLGYGGGANVGTLLGTRFALAAVLLFALVALTGGGHALRRLSTRDVATGLAFGAFGYALQSGAYFVALERMDASVASLLLYTFPAMVAVTAVVIGRERLSARSITALVLATSGLVFVVAGAGGAPIDALGAAFALLAAAVYTGFILLSEPVTARIDAPVFAALVCTGAAVALLGGSVISGSWHPAEVTAAGWGWIACIAVISTVAAMALFFAGLRRVGPTTAAILATVEPLMTVVLAFLVFGEVLTAAQLAGGALVLAAVVVLNAPPLRRARLRPATA